MRKLDDTTITTCGECRYKGVHDIKQTGMDVVDTCRCCGFVSEWVIITGEEAQQAIKDAFAEMEAERWWEC